MSSVALKLPVSETRASGWIIGAADDITWFLCSALGGYATIFLFKAGVPLAPILLAFIFVVDGPHVWSTMTRTYFDKSERQKRRLQLLLWCRCFSSVLCCGCLGMRGCFLYWHMRGLYYHHANRNTFWSCFKSKEQRP